MMNAVMNGLGRTSVCMCVCVERDQTSEQSQMLIMLIGKYIKGKR